MSNILVPAPLWVETATQRVLQEIAAIVDTAPDFHVDDIDDDIISTIIAESFEEFADDFIDDEDDPDPDGGEEIIEFKSDFEVDPVGNVVDLRPKLVGVAAGS